MTARTAIRSATTTGKGTLSPLLRGREGDGPEGSATGAPPGRRGGGVAGARGCIAAPRLQGRVDTGAGIPPGSSGRPGLGAPVGSLEAVADGIGDGAGDGGASGAGSASPGSTRAAAPDAGGGVGKGATPEFAGAALAAVPAGSSGGVRPVEGAARNRWPPPASVSGAGRGCALVAMGGVSVPQPGVSARAGVRAGVEIGRRRKPGRPGFTMAGCAAKAAPAGGAG